MPFDANLVLHDGTAVTANISPTSEDLTLGSRVIDLQPGLANYGSGTPAKGLAAVLIIPDDLSDVNDTLDITIEVCQTVGGTYVEVARFPQITGSSQQGTHIIRFVVDPEERYVRAKMVLVDDSGADFTEEVYVLLTPYAYHKL